MKMKDVDVDEDSTGILSFFSLLSHLCHFVCLFWEHLTTQTSLWLYARGSLLAGLGRPKGGAGIEPGYAACKESTLPVELSPSLL